MARTRIMVVKDLAVSAMADAAHAARAGYDMLIAVKAMSQKIRPLRLHRKAEHRAKARLSA